MPGTTTDPHGLPEGWEWTPDTACVCAFHRQGLDVTLYPDGDMYVNGGMSAPAEVIAATLRRAGWKVEPPGTDSVLIPRAALERAAESLRDSALACPEDADALLGAIMEPPG